MDLHHEFRKRLPTIKAECLGTTAPGDYVAQLGVFEKQFGPYISPCCFTRHPDAINQADDTREKVRNHMRRELRRLRRWGVCVPYLWELRIEHFERLTTFDIGSGLRYHTLQDNLSVRRRLFCWIDKCHHLAEGNRMLISVDVIRTPAYATVYRGWEDCGLDFEDMLTFVPRRDPWVADVLTYCKRFGLRVGEPLDLDVHAADLGAVLRVKGKHGRVRVVPVETGEQRRFLDSMKEKYSPGPLHVHIPYATYAQAYRRLQKVIQRDLVLTKENVGTSGGGLRQGYICDLFESIAGVPPPVRGGPRIAPELDRAARGICSLVLGHGWNRTICQYLGPVQVERTLGVALDHAGLVRAAELKALIQLYDHLRDAERARPRVHRIDRDPLKLKA